MRCKTYLKVKLKMISFNFFFVIPFVGNEYDTLMKNFQIQPIESPLHMQKDLDEQARFKRKFGLYALDLALLSEFQCTTMDQTIEKRVLILQMKRRLKQIGKEAVKTKNDLNVAKKYAQFFSSFILEIFWLRSV